MNSRFAAPLVAFAVFAVPQLTAQEPAAPTPPSPKAVQTTPAGRKVPTPIPLKVTVLLSRYNGEKRLSSMPYVIGVTATDRSSGPPQKTTLRMGVDVPVIQTVFGGETKGPSSSYNYRPLGTNIDCTATFDESVPNVFQLSLTVTDSSLGLDSEKRSGLVPDVPSFRNFNASFTALLREGQTMQYMSATDPVSGEV